MPQVQRFRELPEAERKELWASLALRHCKGLGARSCKRLLMRYASAFRALQHRKHWGSLGIKLQPIQTAISEAWREHARIEWEALARCNPFVLMWSSEAYPSQLREIADPPLLLYGEGDFSLLASPCFAVVGSRNASEHGLRVAHHLSKQLATCGITIVAGMARGIDCAAHLAAIAEVGCSIGVLGTGIDVCYPVENKKLYASMQTKGLLLTEFAPQTKPLANNFPVRNRLISGLCLGILVVEATEKSGSLITARSALEQDREVYVVPGPAMNAHFKGCQQLVREGARPVFTADDIIHDLAPQLQNFDVSISMTFPSGQNDDESESAVIFSKSQSAHLDMCLPQLANNANVQPVSVPAKVPQLEPLQKRIVDFLVQQGTCHLERLAMELEVPIQSLNSHLMELELSGILKRLPGAHFTILEGAGT